MSRGGERPVDSRSRRVPGRRTVAIVAAGLVPWVVIPSESGFSLVFSFGFVTPRPLHVQSVFAYVDAVDRLPRALLAYPIASVLYVAAIANRALAVVDREDDRVTAGLLGLAGLDLLYFAVAYSSFRVRATIRYSDTNRMVIDTSGFAAEIRANRRGGPTDPFDELRGIW